MKSPIFLFSLPRSGSTLLQRILMSHPDIASIAEPWLMLPFSYAFRRNGVLSEYSHATAFRAFEDFVNNLPNKEDDYYNTLGTFIETLYSKLCFANEKYFLDKTPRYYNVISEISKIFPNAKFIFLFRNPIHIMASMLDTWFSGRLKYLYQCYRDLHVGPKALSDGYNLVKHSSYALQYESFVINPKKYIREICDYLEITHDESAMLDNFSNQDTKGSMGDPTGVKVYKKVSPNSLDKWKTIFNNSYRQHLIYKYISSIDDNTLSMQGYDKKLILQEILSMDTRKGICIKDRIDKVYSDVVRLSKLNICFGANTKNWARNQFLS